MTVGRPVFAAYNGHIGSCGRSPEVVHRAADPEYRVYWENEHGEQFVLVVDRAKKTGTLHAGDFGWQHPITIANKRVDADKIFSATEAIWLQVSWLVATGEFLKVTTANDVLDVAPDGTVSLKAKFKKPRK